MVTSRARALGRLFLTLGLCGLGCAKVNSVASTDGGGADHAAAPPDGGMPAPEVAAPVDTGPTSNTPDVPVAPPKPWGGQTIDPSAPANAPTMFTGSAMA